MIYSKKVVRNMNDKIDFFENGEYRLITNLINDRIENLKKYKDFNTKYT